MIVVPADVAARPGLDYWPFAKLMARLGHVQVVVAGRRVRIDPELTLCSGRGNPVVRGGTRRWNSFDCIQTTDGGQGRDLEFRLRIVGLTRLAVSDVRYAGR